MVELKILLVFCFVCVLTYTVNDVKAPNILVPEPKVMTFDMQMNKLESLEAKYKQEVEPIKHEIKKNNTVIKEKVEVLKTIDVKLDSVIKEKNNTDKKLTLKSLIKKLKNQ